MAFRKPYPQLPSKLGQEWESVRGWLVYAARKLGFLPEALTATKLWNPGSLADGDATSTSVDVPGALPGDPVSVGLSSRVRAGMFLTGAVETESNGVGVVWVTLGNLQAGTHDLGEGTLTVIVWKVT